MSNLRATQIALLVLLGIFVAPPCQLRAQVPEGAGLLPQIQKLIQGLDDDQFHVRQAASLELIRIGTPADFALRRAVTNSNSLEVQLRAAEILRIVALQRMPVVLKSLAGQHQNIVTAVAFSPDGKSLASMSEDGTAVLWEWQEGKVQHVLKGHAAGVVIGTFSPDGKTLATGSRDAKVILWNAQSGERRATLEDHTACVNAVVYSHDGSTFVTGSSDKTIKVRDGDGKLRFSLAGHQQDVIALALSADGKTLVSAGGNWDNPLKLGELKVWNLDTRKELWAAAGEFGGIWGVDLSPDGKQLAGASIDGKVRIWDMATGNMKSVLKEHTDRVLWVAYLPGSQGLASSGLDGFVRFWDTAGPLGKAAGQVEAKPVQRFAFSPSERVLATAGSDRTVTIWRIPE